jgi:hypothetical protein
MPMLGSDAVASSSSLLIEAAIVFAAGKLA